MDEEVFFSVAGQQTITQSERPVRHAERRYRPIAVQSSSDQFTPANCSTSTRSRLPDGRR